MLKDLFHGAVDEGRLHLLSVVGIGGIGKSRLSWEFLKYIDGLIGDIWWHRGRCLAYGDGVTYWALSEMVRSRAGIAEEEEATSAARKLRTCVETFVTGPGGARLGRAPPGASPRLRRSDVLLPGGTVRRVAAVLRADRRSTTRW